jgi:DNA-binding transcriptional regulator YhcF (GntR family)
MEAQANKGISGKYRQELYGPIINPSLPVAEQVVDYYRSMILDGRLRFGDELPPADQVKCASRMTILNAYRKLADAGYITLQRAKKTRVAKSFENQRYVILSYYSKQPAAYEDALFVQYHQLAFYKNRKPDVFYLGHGDDIMTLGEAKAAIPDSLNTAINQGQVRAAFIHHTDRIPGVIELLEEKKIPYVTLMSYNKNIPYVCFDEFKIYEDAVRFLAGKGCRNIKVCPWHWGNPPSKLKGLLSEFPGLEWGKTKRNDKHTSPIEEGRNFALECLNSSSKRPDALIVADDIAGLGALVELYKKGLRIPQDIRLLVTSHKSQILPVFSGCDLIITPFEDLVTNSVSLAEKIIRGEKPAEGYETLEHQIVEGGGLKVEG